MSWLGEARRSYRVARDLADSYGGLAALYGLAVLGAYVAAGSALLTPVALLVALLSPSQWPWIFLAPVVTLASAALGVALVLWVLLRALPRRARALLAAARGAGEHAVARAGELAELARRGRT